MKKLFNFEVLQFQLKKGQFDFRNWEILKKEYSRNIPQNIPWNIP